MFTPDELRELPEAISLPRFATYLRARNNDRVAALRLYCWNMEVSAAFMSPLQMCEVSVRNGIVEAIEAVHGAAWPWSNGFLRSLPVPRVAGHYDPASNLRFVAAQFPTVGKVVAELNLAFWEKMMTRGQDQRLWAPHFVRVFPGVPAGLPIPVARNQAHQSLFEIRKVRNRIAHHEPIFARNLREDYGRMRELIAWRRPFVGRWMDKQKQISELLANMP